MSTTPPAPLSPAGATSAGGASVAAADGLEHALRSEALCAVAAGVAHDVKNPLNAMALQLALLGEKLPDAPGAAGHLAALKEQIGRVNEVMRRFLDVTDPAGPLAVDVAALLVDAVALLGHEARRRRVTIALAPAGGAVRSGADPGRVGRLVLGLLAVTVAETPDDGRLGVRVRREDGGVVLELERPGGPPGEVLAALSAAEPEGALEVRGVAGGAAITLRLPGEERT